jgi:hypothetical protein
MRLLDIHLHAHRIMNCLWQDIPDTTDERGWRRVQCLRCGLKLHPTPHEHGKIRSECRGTPFWYEFGYWTELVLAVIYLDKRRWLWLKGQLRLEPKCGCQQRQAALNTWGEKLRVILKRLWYNSEHKEN